MNHRLLNCALAALLLLCSVCSAAIGQTYTDTGAALPGVSGAATAWGDYDNDGRLDLLVAGLSGSTRICKLFHNDGSGVFTEVTGTGLPGVENGSVAWGDFNHDNFIDLAVAGTSDSGAITKVYVNNGNGTLSDSGAVLTGVTNCSIAWGDYNNDGKVDLAVAGAAGSTNIAKVYKNNGNGTFTDTAAALTGVKLCSLAWGDYDNDGDLDLAISGQVNTSTRRTIIYRNDNGSRFAALSTTALIGVSGSAIAWGDVDNDGDLDLAVTGVGSDTSLRGIIYKNMAGVFGSANTISIPAMWNGSLAFGDFDNDNYTDLLVSGQTSSSSASSVSTKILRNNSGASFADSGITLPGTRYSSVAWADMDDDGGLDFALAGAISGGSICKVYQAGSLDKENTVPSAPTWISASSAANGILFKWNAGADVETSTGMLTYNLRVGTTPGGDDVYNSLSDSTGKGKVVARGNAGKLMSQWVFGLDGLNNHYYYSVQTVDGQFARSAWAPEQVTSSPVCVSVTPSGGMVALNRKLVFSIKFSDPDGYADIYKCNMLINTSCSSTNGVGVMCMPYNNTLYLATDDGASWHNGYAAGSDNIAENSQAKIYYKDTTITKSGNDITINLCVELKDTMAGAARFIYMRADERMKYSTGWNTMGKISAGYAPENVSLQPSSGQIQSGTEQTYTAVYRDAAGTANIDRCCMLINRWLVAANSISVIYDPTQGLLYMMDDDGVTRLGGFAPGSDNTIQNSQGVLNCKNTTVTASGNDITVNWAITAKPTSSLVGNANYAFLRVENKIRLVDGWDRMGWFTLLGE